MIEQCILAILDKDAYRAKQSSKSVITRWQIRWRDRKKVRKEWMDRTKMTKIFGSDEARKAVEIYISGGLEVKDVKGMIMSGQGSQADRHAVAPLSEYELERLRRIEENKELMKQLGI